MGLARTIRSRADLDALRHPDAQQPFWAARQPGSDDVDMVFVVPRACSLGGAPDMPGCVALLSETQDFRTPSVNKSRVPSVESLGGAVGSIRDGDLVLVDATRGEVLVDPTDRALSAFQAKLTGLNPIRRFFVDCAHETVRAPDGHPIVVAGLTAAPMTAVRSIQVGAPGARCDGVHPVSLGTVVPTSSRLDLDDAIAQGPDLLVLNVGCHCEVIGEAVSSAHGKPVLFIVHPEGCCEKALVQAAAWGDVTAAVPVRGASDRATDFGEHLEQATEDLIEEGFETGRVRVAGWIAEGEGNPEALAECRIERLIVDLGGRLGSRPDQASTILTPWLADALAAARSIAVPVYCAVGPDATHFAAEIIDAGIGGIVAPFEEVQPWKAALRRAVWSDGDAA